jgi:hypothetical protein
MASGSAVAVVPQRTDADVFGSSDAVFVGTVVDHREPASPPFLESVPLPQSARPSWRALLGAAALLGAGTLVVVVRRRRRGPG